MPITEDGVLSVRPGDIPTDTVRSRHFFDAFGHYETEVSARWLVRFAKDRDQGWKPFTKEDIEAFYNKGGFRDFYFNKLISDGFIIEIPAGTVNDSVGTILSKTSTVVYHFTEEFIARCYRSATKP